MPLMPPPPNVCKRYIRLLAMAERGTAHEKDVAETKLASLRARYDLSDAARLAEDKGEEDLFDIASSVVPDVKSHRLIVIDVQDSRVGNFVKSMLLDAFQIQSTWRTTAKSGETALYVGAKIEAIPCLQHIAKVITDSFVSLWKKFAESTGADPNDEPAVYEGLYDGVMRNARAQGQAIPSRNRKEKKKGGRKSEPNAASATVRPHAYSIALEIGGQIRIKRSLGEIESKLATLLEGRAG